MKKLIILFVLAFCAFSVSGAVYDDLNNEIDYFWAFNESSSPIYDYVDGEDMSLGTDLDYQQDGIYNYSAFWKNNGYYLSNIYINVSESFTLGTWIKPYSDTEDGYVVGTIGGWIQFAVGNANNANRCGATALCLSIYDGSNYDDISTSIPFNSSAWFLMVGTYNGTHACMYVNNDSTCVLSNGVGSNRQLYIGGDDDDDADSNLNAYTEGMFIYEGYGLNQDEVDFLYNQGSPTDAQFYPYSTPPAIDTTPIVTINSPQDIRSNESQDVQYTVTDDNSTFICQLYVDDVLNATNTSVSNNTLSSFSVVWDYGVHDYYVNCSDTNNIGTSSIYTYDFDDREPFIQSGSPSADNSSVFDSFTMDIIGNVTDDAIWKVNRTIFYPNGTVFYNNYSGELANLTNYNWSDTFNTTTFPNSDGYILYIEATDPHTKNDFPPANDVLADQFAKKLSYEFDEGTIDIQLIASDVMPLVDTISTTKLQDRYTFDIDFKSQVVPNKRFVFRVTSTLPISYLDWSEYNAHLVIGDLYWVDFEGVEGTYTVTKVDDYTYDIELYTSNAVEQMRFESLGGLNYADLSIEFEVNNCEPDWTCIGYDDCDINDTQDCNNVSDNNACGLPYSGDYSEFVTSSCNYCSYDVEQVNQTDCDSITGLYTECWTDNNWSTCCDVTGIDSDCYLTSTDPVKYNWTSDTICWTTSCDFFEYGESDLPKAIINVVVKGIIAVGVFVAVIVILIGGSYLYQVWRGRPLK